MASEGFHEQVDKLSPETMDMHRAITSLMEELEAVDRILQKVHDSGMNSLTRAERKLLKTATERQRHADLKRAGRAR